MQANDKLLAVLTTSELIKAQLAHMDEGARSAVPADVVTNYILSLPPEAQTPMFCRFLAAVETLIDERHWPAVGAA
jgi:hypothetical protein